MTQWLFDTLVWTAALIALVLVFRRPVARYLGPNAAYALWALPLLRLLLPPIILPAWLAPAEEAPVTATYMVTYSDAAAAMPATASTATFAVDWTLIALAVWLMGAAVFLMVRFSFYFRMRSELLEAAFPVGDAGRIRLVETPATNSPIAFGVIDKVVALPKGFMAMHDRVERDLALQHELSHHAAHDLLANFVVQPLFALHWFNPLAWYGWRAMRRDQEAACDARVIALRGGADKAAYAAVIASFAAGPNVALAAPMACPVIGEKSIIHRLRSLTMSDISPRRRMAGRALMGAALLALPLTASVTYAESLMAPAMPAAPAAPAPVAAAPAPPVPPTAVPLALTQQAAPEAPLPPEAPEVIIIRKDGEAGTDTKVHKIIRRSHSAMVFGDDKMSPEEREAFMRELREELAEVDIEMREAKEEIRMAMVELKKDHHTSVAITCEGDRKSGEISDSDGRRIVRICTSEIMANALTGLKEARKAIAENPEMSREMREEVLRSLDSKIENWADEG